MFAQISDLQVWHALVKQYISDTAIIDDDQVFIYGNGFLKVPMYDAASVLSMMNTNPHILQDVYRQWERGEDSIERAFCTSLFNQLQTELAIADEASMEVAVQAVRDAFSKLMVGGGLLSLVDALVGFEVLTFDTDGAALAAAEETKEPILQNALFSALKK